jgi:gephyrin
MAEQRLKAAILVVSDTAFQDPSSDRVFGTLIDVFPADGPWEKPITKIVPDDVLQIQRAVCDWTDSPSPVNLVLISGGTGFAVKDNTPEAVTPLLHRHAPGLVYVH